MSRTRQPVGNEDVDFYRCKRCDFPCDLSRDKIKAGLGLSYSTLTGVISQTQYPDDHAVTYGCPQCGCGEYNRYQK